jgi:GcrA cell cycle regulator
MRLRYLERGGIDMVDWTAERVEVLLAGYNDGSSMKRIAMNLGGGATKNAVIGKLHRMGHWPGKTPARPKEERPKRSRHAAQSDATLPQRLTRREHDIEAALESDSLRDLPPDQSPDAVSLFDVQDDQCRWPLNDPGPGFLFCGTATIENGCPYCRRHSRMAFVAVKGERRPYIPSRNAAGRRIFGQ